VRRLALPIAFCALVVLWASRAPSSRVVVRAPVPQRASVPIAEGDREPWAVAVAPDEGSRGAQSTPVPPELSPRQTLRGIVVDPEGAGVAAIRIRAQGWTPAPIDRRRHARMPPAFDGQVISDAGGRFEIDLPDVICSVLLAASTPTWVPPEQRSVFRQGGSNVHRGPNLVLPADARAMSSRCDDGWPEVKLILERGVPVGGVVETEAGAAAAGALVTARWRDDQPGWRSAETVAGEHGEFRILVPADALLTAAPVAANGVFGKEGAWYWPARPGACGLRLVLHDPVSIELRVHGASSPIDSMAVRVMRAALPEDTWPLGGEFQYPNHDAQTGLWRIRGLLPGSYDIEVYPRDPDALPATVRVFLPGGPYEVLCPQATRIEGFLDGPDSGGFDVTWTGPANMAFARTDSSGGPWRGQEGRTVSVSGGSFLLEGVGQETGAIYARRPGDPRCAYVASYSATQGSLRLALTEARAIRGHVEGAQASSLLLQVRAVRGQLTQMGEVEADGSFAIVGLPPLDFRVELRSGAWLHDAHDDVPAGATGVRLRVRLPDTEPGDGP